MDVFRSIFLEFLFNLTFNAAIVVINLKMVLEVISSFYMNVGKWPKNCPSYPSKEMVSLKEVIFLRLKTI